MNRTILAAIGRAADAVTRRLHPEPYRTYNIDRNINYTNVCTAVCDFCAFYRKPKQRRRLRAAARGAATRRSTETVDLGGDQILMQGGLHPDFKLEWYEELLHDIKQRFPQVEHSRLQPAGNLSLHQGQQAAAADGAGATARRRDWAAFPAAARRSWSIACARRSRAAKC